jgi:non-specific protein-tyrosine kinase
VPERSDSLQQFLAVLARRKLVVLLSVVLTPLAALGYSLLQDPLYEASATVLASSGGVGSGLSQLPGLSSTDDSERFSATQVELARLPVVAARVVKAAPLFESSVSFLGRSRVTAETDADILHFNVTDLDPDAAARLATIYARSYANYRNELDLQSIRSTRASIARRLAALEAAGRSGSALYAQLRRAVRELDAAEAVRGSGVVVVQPAVDGYQIVPRTKRNLALGLVLGLMLGIGLAFLVDRLDKRVRSAEDAEGILGLPVLGELSTPPTVPERAKTRVSMVELPFGSYAEGVRKLRSNVEFANLDLGARVLMVTSAISGEGKTTVASDLAVALARSGREVVLCDLDARAPEIARLFELGGAGLVDVAFGAQTLEAALAPVQWVTGRTPTPVVRERVPVPFSETSDEPAVASARSPGSPRGSLHVLPLGRRLPPSPPEFVGSATVHNIVSELAAAHEIVILDTPPLLPVSDALTISTYADAALIVCGLNRSSRTDLRRLRKLLATSPTHVLGFVVTGVAAEEGYGPYFVPESAGLH